ncbi:hypothetical protein B0H14DRAFT_2571067 [Mycena olivaceomarginata]|nr:hypothetical protein B0H14DRAFT_2571067 [Mycena olivaceomarginata]
MVSPKRESISVPPGTTRNGEEQIAEPGIVYDLSVVCGDSSEELVNELLKKASGRRSGVYEHDNLFGGSAGGRGEGREKRDGRRRYDIGVVLIHLIDEERRFCGALNVVCAIYRYASEVLLFWCLVKDVGEERLTKCLVEICAPQGGLAALMRF